VEITLKISPAFKGQQDKPFLLLVLPLIGQVIFAFLISKINLSDNVFSHFMYIPIIISAAIFDYRIGVLSGVIAELLIDIFAPVNVSLFDLQQMYIGFIRLFTFCFTGLSIGLIKQKIEEISFQKNSDKIHPFTQLPYWESLVENMDAMAAKKSIIHFRFFLLEISNQNEILATFGLDYIDKVNEYLIRMIKAKYKDSKLFLIRLNTFALILPQIRQDIQELIRLVEQPIIVNGIPIYCEITIGEASYPESGQTADAILKNGFIALNEARQHKKPYQQYELGLHDPEIPILLGQFQNAIQNQEIEFHYQPIVDRSDTVHSLEALVRWNHPIKGMIPPDQFITDLEFTRITNILTYYSLEYNLNNMTLLFDEGFNLDFSINISITNLYQPDFADRIIKVLESRGFPAHHLSLEITERGFLADNLECRSNLDRLVNFGIKLSIDDFGVGFTSISNFRNKMINSIKIDKSFIEDIHLNQANQAILQGILSIAKASNLLVIAEGIETVSEKEKLIELGVNYFQGYLISKPMAFDGIQ
jgi:EAL domain-containing protein (putative c-di-GMP-specific phosphodiesterase class I)